MDTTDTLQTKIDMARSALPKESRSAIDAINWKAIILGMNGKYNSQQLDALETETELLLCGLLSTENYAREIETRMKIPKSEVGLLIDEMDKLIFKKMQAELIKKLENSEPVVFDPRFETLPKNIQEAIAKSNWQNKLYQIGTKRKLPIDKMAFLEEVTVKVISGKMLPNIYEKELTTNLSQLEPEELKEIITEVNEKIMKVIRSFEQRDSTKEMDSMNNIDDEIPLPPYAKQFMIKESLPEKYTAPVTPKSAMSGSESTIYKGSGIEMVDEVNGNKIPAKEDIKVVKPDGLDMLANKLSGLTASERTISDQSIPKVDSPSIPKPPTPPGNLPTKQHDPYHEAIE